MREHKYKAYHKEFDILTDIELINIIMRGVGVNYGCGQKVWRFNEIELMQSTGLKDKNGVEIYEGYVVKVTDDDEIDELDSNIGIGEIIFFAGMWYINGSVQNSLYDIAENYDIEVIGNIYQDKHLLEDRRWTT